MNQFSPNDADLINRFKSTADKAIIAELYQRYLPLVLGVCFKYLKDREECKDAAMLIFEKLPDNLKKHEVSHFKSWLYALTKNHCLMILRAQKGKKFIQFEANLMESDAFVHLDNQEEPEVNLSKLKKCIDELIQEQKKCVELFYLEERCYKEITQATGFDYNKVKSHIQNGKRNLKICMERND